MKSIDKLEKWYEEIASMERLKIEEVKELYEKANMVTDINLKKTYMDKIILGTLYVVYDYIKRNDIEVFCSSSFDMDDIISSFNEVWINKIYNGDLLKLTVFRIFLQLHFLVKYTKIYVRMK